MANTRKTATKAPAPAKKMEASGALIEPAIVDGVDTGHPAIDDNPREGQPAEANRIDLNDPTLTDAEAVEKNLEAQSQG